MADTANPIVTKLVSVARRLKAIAVVDGPEDEKELKKFRSLNGNARLYIVSPKVKVAADDKTISAPASSYVAGVFSRINFWQSPSNQPLYGILGTSVGISFEMDDPESTAQQYNAMQIATLIREDGGFRVWGAKGTGSPSDSKTSQIQKVRIADAIEEAIAASTRWAVAAGINRDFIGAVERKVNNFFSDLIREGAIVGGECKGDTERNTADALARGDVYWKYSFTPTAVAETLHFEGFNTNKYYENFGEGAQ
jgi:phage tail sheath protein FI